MNEQLEQLFLPPTIVEIHNLLHELNCVVTNSHLVYTAGDHGSAYVNKDAVIPHTMKLFRVARAMAMPFMHDRWNIQAVIGPAVGGAILASWVSFNLSEISGEDVLGVYADKDGDELVIKRGYNKLIAGKRVLVAEDILNTGGSAAKVVRAARNLGCEVVGVTVICNRNAVTPDDLGGNLKLASLLDVKLDKRPPDDCPLCRDGVPINIELGHGKAFLAKKTAQ